MVKVPGSTCRPSAQPHGIPVPVASHGEPQGGERGKAGFGVDFSLLLLLLLLCLSSAGGALQRVTFQLGFGDAVALRRWLPEASIMWLI